MKQLKRMQLLAVITTLFSFISCEKGWLEAKNDLNRVVPVTLADARAVLRSSTVLNIANNQTSMALLASDDLYIDPISYRSLYEIDKNIYAWAPIIEIGSMKIGEWNTAYEQVFYANIALEIVNKIPRSSSNQQEYDDVLGSALFFRAKAFWGLAQLFAPVYQSENAENTTGIPLRLSSDPNVATVRASVKETYDQILTDLKLASSLLTSKPAYKTDASKQATYGLLSRCFLSMSKYSEAKLYADSCLDIHNELLDYNDMLKFKDNTYPFEQYHTEVLHHSLLAPNYVAYLFNYSMVDELLYDSYSDDDLRKVLFFATNSLGGNGFRGTYSGANNRFGGIATDEIVITRAESKLRTSDITGALEDLNYLLLNRIITDSFAPCTEKDPKKLLAIILNERRKELLFRGLRWTDLRRLNLDPLTAITLKRSIEDEIFTLPANSSRYVFPIPDYIITTTGIDQNKRIND